VGSRPHAWFAGVVRTGLPLRAADRMSRTPARVTQADVARCVRAAMQAGAGGVIVRRDGSIFISLKAPGEEIENVVNPNLGLDEDDGADL
jgi:hypothetical protein